MPLPGLAVQGKDPGSPGGAASVAIVNGCPVDAGWLEAMASPVAPLIVPVPRLNLAGRCGMCLGRGCADTVCVAQWERIVWAVCSDCDGSGYRDIAAGQFECCDPCDCLLGVREMVSR
jgi:hypothetical protein